MKKIIFFFSILLAFFSCKKDTLVTVGNNNPPDDTTLSTTTVELYINRTFIRCLGIEPDSIELATIKTNLLNNNLDSSSRNSFANSIFSKPEYLPHLYDQMKVDYLDNVDTSEFGQYLFIFNNYLNDSTYLSSWPALLYERDRLLLLQSAYTLFITNQIDLRELQKRMCNNYFYDNINMGSANFVVFTFKHLIGRNPTMAEQSYGISMVEGNNSTIFLQAGNSKENFLDILLNSTSYYEGQVIQIYNNLIYRVPSSYEMSSGTLLFLTTQSYSEVQKRIITSNEFIGN